MHPASPLSISALALALVSCALHAQTYPQRAVRLIVPFAPGGNVDITARILSAPLTKALGQSVVVDNRPGASGMIGADLVAKAAPDGYTLLMGSTSVMTNVPALYQKMPYDILRDFAAVGRVSDVPIVIVVHPSVPAKNAREFVALAKAKPGRVLMASAGIGTTNHLIGELFQLQTATKITLVHYKGSGPALIDLLGGQVDAHVDQISSAIGYIKAGRIRAIAVTASTRAAMLPEVPTLQESGIPGVDVSTVTGILAPAATPKAIIEQLHAVLGKVLALPAVKQRFAELGAQAFPSTSEQLAVFIRDDLARWKRVVREANIKVE